MQVIAGADFSRRRRGPFLSSIELVVLGRWWRCCCCFYFPGRNFDDPATWPGPTTCRSPT